MSDKSCKNCNKYDNCTLLSCALTAITNFHEHGFYCCDFEPKKKTVKLYRYTYDELGTIEQTKWTSDPFTEYRGEWEWDLLKTETKEIQI